MPRDNKKSHIVSPITRSENIVFQNKIDCLFIINKYKEIYNIDVSKYFQGLKQIEVYQCLDTDYRFFYPFNLEGDSDFYSALQEDPYYYLAWKWEYQIVFDRIKSGGRVLEVGCGKGSFLAKLQTHNIMCHGLELNKRALKECKKRGLIVSDQTVSEQAKLFREKYDIVCSFQVLEHVAKAKEFIEDSLALIKPGGKFFISVPNNNSFLGLDPTNILNLPPHHMGLWGEHSLANLERYFNMKLIKIYKEPLQRYHIRYYYRVVVESKINSIFKKWAKVINKILLLPTCFMLLLLSFKIKGFTVIAEYKKL